MEENDPEEELKLILIGRMGSGKSASGNTILGRKYFLSGFSGGSVTKDCQLETSDYHVEEEAGRRSRRKKVVVVDLPGFGNTHLTQEQIITEISRCVALTAPGPHAFLLVVPLGRYTEEENMAVTMMVKVFGEAAVCNHTVVLFTMGDRLKEPIEQYLVSAPDRLKALIDRCGGRYHVLNNEAPSDVQQVHELLGKVRQVVEVNGGGCYTNAMYREVEAAIREEKDRVWREEKDREEDRARKEDEPSAKSSSSGVPLSHSMMQTVRNGVASVLTGLVGGALCGAAASLAATAIPALMGDSLVCSRVTMAAGGFAGGCMGLMSGLKADNPLEGAQQTMYLVGSVGAGVSGLALVGGGVTAIAESYVDGRVAAAAGAAAAPEAAAAWAAAAPEVAAAAAWGAAAPEVAGMPDDVGAVGVAAVITAKTIKISGNKKTGKFKGKCSNQQ